MSSPLVSQTRYHLSPCSQVSYSLLECSQCSPRANAQVARLSILSQSIPALTRISSHPLSSQPQSGNPETNSQQTPESTCWPSTPKWTSLNASVDGQLIHNHPIAKPCYPGPDYDASLCQHISEQWTDSIFRESQPVGYTYPLANACPPVSGARAGAGAISKATSCNLGNAPVYTINATKADHVAEGIRFAKENNVRLVVKNTGHDIVGRSVACPGIKTLPIILEKRLTHPDREDTAV